MPKFNAAFRKWFGDSKVVDGRGRPLIAYHGTAEAFSAFDPSKVGSTFEVDYSGFFFTNSKKTAEDYADAAAAIARNRKKTGQPRVVSAYLSIKNPWVIFVDTDTQTGKSPIAHFESGDGVFNVGQNRVIAYAIDSGYDGMIIRDERGIDDDHEALFVVFSPTQIKAVDNDGTFDVDDSDIRSNPDYSGEHGAPTRGEGNAPLHDLTRVYPEDIYSGDAARMYGDHSEVYPDWEPLSIIHAARWHPGKKLKVYRAVPKALERPKINAGDWVSLTHAYAHDHGKSNLNNEYKLISKLVSARDIWTEANSLHEWGYDPQPYNGEIERLWKGVRLAHKAGDHAAAKLLEAEARRMEDVHPEVNREN